MLRHVPGALLALATLLPSVSATAETPLGAHAVRVQTGVRAVMRDGVSLVADVFRPEGPGPFPVLLQRTPYNRREADVGVLLASHGYIVVLQDTRGRYDSEGEFYPFLHEAADGYDTVEWAAGLPGSDGRVGMFGGSYVGATQMLAASTHPPHLLAIFPYVTASQYYEGWTYQSGAFMEWFASTWASLLAEDTLRREAHARARPGEWVQERPVATYRLLGLPTPAEAAPYYRDWVEHETDDVYWRRWRVSDHYPEMTVQSLNAGGWHDLFLKGTIENYVGLHHHAATPEAREGQRLLLGPWCHGETSPAGKIGDVVFGRDAVLDMNQTILDWFDYSLKGEQNRFATGAPVRLFVMGENRWRDEKEFPLARARATRFYLHSASSPVGIRGDGRLGGEPPKNEPPARFVYDPRDPVPTIGGRLCCGEWTKPGPYDQRPNESRPDVLVFSTPPLEQDLEATGYVTVELYAASSAVDTDFTALLADVDPSGYARFLTDGIVRARYRHSREAAEPLEPGKVSAYTIDLWATGNVFKAGHRIRLYVSSSNFPRFDRNPNTGEPLAVATRMVPAEQTIFHDAARPSALVLPVVPR
jgi:putative CocE/NonD family hydrolase